MVDYQSDLKVILPDGTRFRSSIALSPSGDIQLVTGREKLISQLVFAILNENTFPEGVANSKSNALGDLKTALNVILRRFKQNQIAYVQQYADSDFLGFGIYRKEAGADTDYARISNQAVTWNFEDTDVYNEKEYLYGISKLYKGMLESKYVDVFRIAPTSNTENVTVLSGRYAAIVNGNKSVSIYVDYNKTFKASELLQNIIRIQATLVKTDPRRVLIDLVIENYLGEQVSLSSYGAANAYGA
ncbi:MAG: hypothetical protein WC444_05160 [Candidatus Paceibacterota bacterium]